MKNANAVLPERKDIQIDQELTVFLKIAMAEIKLAIREASSSVQSLTKTYMEMVRDVHEIKAVTEQTAKPGSSSKDALIHINRICDSYLNKVQEGTVGFQFYDKLTQRLCHTADNMNELANVAETEDQLFDTEIWQKLKNNIRARYNMEKDRAMFDAVMDGASIKEALRIASEQADNKPKDDNVELF